MADRRRKKKGITLRDILAIARNDVRVLSGLRNAAIEAGRSETMFREILEEIKNKTRNPTPLRDYRVLGIRIVVFQISKSLPEHILYNVARRPGGPWLAFYVETFGGPHFLGFYVPVDVEDELISLLEDNVDGELIDVFDCLSPLYPHPSTVEEPDERACLQNWSNVHVESLPPAGQLRVKTVPVPLMLMALHEIFSWSSVHYFIRTGFQALFENRYGYRVNGVRASSKLFLRYYRRLVEARAIVGRYLFPLIMKGGYESYLVIAPRSSVGRLYGTLLHNYAIPSLYVGSRKVMAPVCIERCGDNLQKAGQLLEELGASAYRISWVFRDQVPWEMYNLYREQWCINPRDRPTFDEVVSMYKSFRILVHHDGAP